MEQFHKFGQAWDPAEVQGKGDAVLNIKNVCLVKIFWKICLDYKLSRKEPSYSSVLFNLPVRYWPDVMTDNWEISRAGGGKYYKNYQKDPVNIFKSFRHIFCEPEAGLGQMSLKTLGMLQIFPTRMTAKI